MNKLNIIFFLSVCIFLSIVSAYTSDYVSEIYFNDSNLPVSDTIKINFQLVENGTMYFTQIKNADYNIVLNYLSNYTLISESNHTYDFTYIIPQQKLDCDMNTSTILNITNNINTNISYILEFRFVGNKTSSFINEQGFENITLQSGQYKINVTKNYLPRSGVLEYFLLGNNGSKINVTYCGLYLTCPDYAVVDADSSTMLYINYLLPDNLSVGYYNTSFNISTVNITREIKIDISIEEPYFLFERYIWSDNCFKGSTTEELRKNIAVCINEQEQFNAKRMAEMLSYFLNGTNTTCQNNTITNEQLVLVGNISDYAYSSWNDCRNELTSCQQDRANLTDEVTSCSSSLNNFLTSKNNEIYQLQNMIQLEKYNGNTKLAALKSDTTARLIKYSVLLILIGIICYYGYLWKKWNWR